MKIKPISYTHQDVIDFLENRCVRSMHPLEYGKSVQTAVEEYLTYVVNSISEEILLVNIAKIPELIKEYKYENNGPGFDRLYLPTKKKYQIKLRQVDGKTPFSKQVHFENTRRHSEKNKNESSKSGHVRYSVSEFDYVIVVLCHIVDGVRTDYNKWSYSVIKSSDLEDVNCKGYCYTNIPSKILLDNKCDDIYMLTDKLKNI
jgi:hypothetical protein